ncbi:MAG: serine/threonine protein phosphatase [Clostridiales bacterium]|nr:MAG: serine/threonine protein phosphatase [Clostridiales bacterium]
MKSTRSILSAILISDVGLRRKQNQDNFFFNCKINENESKHIYLDIEKKLFPLSIAIFDGMGGECLGAEASKITAEMCRKYEYRILEYLSKNLSKEDNEKMFNSFVKEISQSVKKMSDDNGVKLSGSTLVLCFFVGSYAHIISVGDSSAYLIRGSKIQLLNKLDVIIIEQKSLDSKPIKGGLSQFIGIDTNEFRLSVNYSKVKLEKNDKFLFCSDGITDLVLDDEIYKIIINNDLERASKDLLSLSFDRGGVDNTTLALCEVDFLDDSKNSSPKIDIERFINIKNILLFCIIIFIIFIYLVCSNKLDFYK